MSPRTNGYDMVEGLPVAVALVHRPSPHTYAALGAHRARYIEKRRVLRELETEEKLDEAIDDLDTMFIDRPSKRTRVSSNYDEDNKENADVEEWAATTARHDAMYERLMATADSARWKTKSHYSYTNTRASSPISDRTSSPPPFDCGHLVAAKWDVVEDDYIDDASPSSSDQDEEESSDEDYHPFDRMGGSLQHAPVSAFIPSERSTSAPGLMKPNQFSWAPIEVETQRVADRLEMTHLAGRFAAEFESEIESANAFWRGGEGSSA
ncbi:hypothetical protein PENSPDRAFT_117904 [Peniophora sp. CONT]|nr:hypothetical protein PENSPDRAFT_117904 [Peniophora sp. CONT]